MADTDLLFRQTPLVNPADLVFGEVEALPDYEVTVAATFPLTFAALFGPSYEVSVAAAFPLTFAAEALYDNYVDRPITSVVSAAYQAAAQVEAGGQSRAQDARPEPSGAESGWADAPLVASSTEGRFSDTLRSERGAARARHQDAMRVPAARVRGRHQDGLHDRRQSRVSRFQDAAPARTGRHTDWQERYRDRRPTLAARYQDALPVEAGRSSAYRPGIPVVQRRVGRYQDAIPPNGGVLTVIQPPFDPCYLPDPNLVFFDTSFGPALLFRCDRHPVPDDPTATVVVPIRRVYIVLNSVTLRRVVGDVPLPVLDFSLQVDADSWTWSFSATLPYAALADVQPSGGVPVELEATINSVPYRLIAERLTTDRSFERTALKIAGRGRNAVLADPYAAVRAFESADTLTAEQLMADALTDNGIPIGWDLDFGLEDWSVPGGTWAHRGTYLTAVRTIAEAAGGYVQPHRTDQTLRILPRYPAAPWDWAGLTPDFEIPSAVATVEAAEWIDKPIYNRVFVMGERNGRIGRVTRTGTAGDAVAPSVVHPLITAVEASRQRGLAVLSDVGRQVAVRLQMPVLSETGVIPPGSLVRYLDGATTRLGLVRTTSVSGAVQLRQTLGLETHVAP